MTLFSDQLQSFVDKTFVDGWTERQGRVVPDVDSLPMSNTAVVFDSGTVLYADLAESTGLVKNYKPWFAADIYKNYLYCAGRIIERNGGTITAYDGDRVMAVFLGEDKESKAVKSAMQINYAVMNVIQPVIQARWSDEKFVIRQKVGIDTSKLFVAKTGVRGANDLVWVGNAANNAAKMAALSATYSSYISADVRAALSNESRYGGEPKRDMWTDLGSSHFGYRLYGSTWHWSI